MIKKCVFKAIGVVISTAILVGCNQPVSVSDELSSETSAVLFKIAAVANSPFSKLAKKATLTISASDMNTMLRELTITSTGIEGTVAGIPSGKERLFSVMVYDSLDTLQYLGSATIDLPRGATVNVPINIKRITTNAVINGTIIEDDTAITLSTGLVASYPLNGSALDMSGYSNNGTIYGAVVTEDRAGNAQGAYLFDGEDDYIEVPYNSSLDCEKSISVLAWAKSAISGDQYLEDGNILQMGRGADSAYGMCVGKYVDVMQFEFCNHQSSAEITLEAINAATLDGAVRHTIILDTLWHFYAFTFDGELMRAFVDNTLIGSKNAVAGPITDGLPLRIGAESKSLSRFWNGKIDAVRIYNRALSKEEIEAISSLSD